MTGPVTGPSDGPSDLPVDGDRRPAARRGSRRHPVRLAVAATAAVLVLAVVGVALWVRAEAGSSGRPGPQVVVVVAPGSGVGQVIDTLAARGVVSNTVAFRIWSLFNPVPEVQTGSYAFDEHSSFSEVRQVLSGGPNVFALTIPAGFTVRETAERVGQLPGHRSAAFAALAKGGTIRSPWEPVGSGNLDGLLGTGTYTVLPGESDATLLRAMIGRFDAVADQVGLGAGASVRGLTPYQLVTVASIVQKEGVFEKNLGPVARVILNRLAAGMPLQMDSTVLYALGRDGGTVSTRDLAVETPYNTYLNSGLTPTPICFPSKEALKAALDPPAGSWMYFVVVEKDGTEAFSDTYSGQLADEALARRRGLP